MLGRIIFALVAALLFISPVASANESMGRESPAEVFHVIEYESPVPWEVTYVQQVIRAHEQNVWTEYGDVRDELGHLASGCVIEHELNIDKRYTQGVRPHITSDGKRGILRVPYDWAEVGYFTGCTTDGLQDP